MIIVDCSHALVIQFQIDIVLALYGVKCGYFLLQHGLTRVKVGDYRGESTSGDGYRDNTNDHQQNTQQHLLHALSCDVTITYRKNGCRCIIEGGNVERSVI